MRTTPRRAGFLLGLVLVGACVAVSAGPVAPAGAAGPVATAPSVGDATTTIVVTGVPTDGHTFTAYQIATYDGVATVGNLPTGVTLASASPELRAALGAHVAALEDDRNGSKPAPPVSSTGLVQGLDPLHWVALNWPAAPDATDLWGNDADLFGPLRDLADWLAATIAGDPAHLGLSATSPTGNLTRSGNSATATFDLAPGLYLLVHPLAVKGPDTQGPATITGTGSAPLVVGTRIPVGSGFADLYNPDGTLRQTLGVVHAKGDGVWVTKSIDDPAKAASPTFAVGDAIPMRIVTSIPNYHLFPASAPLRFEITDKHTAGLSLPDWTGTDPALADPVLTVGGQTLRYDAGCVVGLANTADPCFAVSTPQTADGRTSWNVKLPAWVLRAHGGDGVVLTFEQRLGMSEQSAGSLAGTPGTTDSNSVWITFSDDPAVPGSVATTADPDVTVFTVPLRVTKLDASTRAPVADVAFSVLTGQETHCFHPTAPGVYWRTGVAPCGDGSTDSPTTAVDGTLTLNGLAGDTQYTVAEVRTAMGYAPENLRVARFTVQAVLEYTGSGNPSGVSRIGYAFSNAGEATSLDAFLATTTRPQTVPTSEGNEQRDSLTESVTVLNWKIADPSLPWTGGGGGSGSGGGGPSLPRTPVQLPLPRTGAEVAGLVAAACLLAVAGTFLVAGMRRRRTAEEGGTP